MSCLIQYTRDYRRSSSFVSPAQTYRKPSGTKHVLQMTSWYTDKTNLVWAHFNLTPVQSLDSGIMADRVNSSSEGKKEMWRNCEDRMGSPLQKRHMKCQIASSTEMAGENCRRTGSGISHPLLESCASIPLTHQSCRDMILVHLRLPSAPAAPLSTHECFCSLVMA